jgi:hypothetical protein
MQRNIHALKNDLGLLYVAARFVGRELYGAMKIDDLHQLIGEHAVFAPKQMLPDGLPM